MKLTKPVVANLALPPGKADVIYFDDELPGFGVRIRAGGKRTYVAQYRFGARHRRVTIGRVDALDLDKARKAARELFAEAGLGSDPAIERAKAKADASVTLGAVVSRYIAFADARLKPRSMVEVRRHLNVMWKPLADLPIEAIDRATVAATLSDLAAERGPVAADRARANLSACFSWAIREGLASRNPVADTNRPAENVKRDRVLSDGELLEIWKATGDDDYGRIVRLLVLTGQRREEVGGMHWPEIREDDAEWHIPGERSKNRRPHVVPLSGEALAVLASVERRKGRALVFGSGGGAFSGWSASKRKLDERIAKARQKDDPDAKAMPAWHLHDLRRTFATRLADLGTAPHVVEALLNHVSGTKAGVAGIYNRALFMAERRAAMLMWGEHVAALVEKRPATVTPIRRGA